MKIPTTVLIGGHTFTILLVEKVDSEDSAGECSIANNEIKIDSSMKQSQKEETLLHEAIHAIDPHMEENAVQSLAAQLYAFLSNNNFLK